MKTVYELLNGKNLLINEIESWFGWVEFLRPAGQTELIVEYRYNGD